MRQQQVIGMNIEQIIIGVTVTIVIGFLLFVSRRKMKKPVVPFYLYADASPDETIKKSELPGLAVACILPHKKGKAILDVPIGQYKKYKKPRQKIERARELCLQSADLTPQRSYIRRLQHLLAERYSLSSTSSGRDPNRHVTYYKA